MKILPATAFLILVPALAAWSIGCALAEPDDNGGTGAVGATGGTSGTGGTAGSGGTAGGGATAGSGGTAGTGGAAGNGGAGGQPPAINYVTWTWDDGCTGFGDTTLDIYVDASDPDSSTLLYTGSVDWCEEDIDAASQTLNCFAGSLTTAWVTVSDPRGNEDTVNFMFESAICEDGCKPGTSGSCP